MAEVDIFVLTSNVQFVRREWQNRAKLKGQDKDLWLTVPVGGSNRQMIRDALIDNSSNWQHKHQCTIDMLYHNTSEPELLARLLECYEHPYERLVDLNVKLIMFLKELLGIDTRVVFDEEVSGNKASLLINICKKYNADTYLSGLGGKHYMDEEYETEIKKHNIAHRFVDRNVTAEYPYTSIHYLLTQGLVGARDIVHGELLPSN